MTIRDLDQTRSAVAALTACIARTLGELNADFGLVFEPYLDKAYAQIREAPGGNGEALPWTRGETTRQRLVRLQS
jgi:hypothetical protein